MKVKYEASMSVWAAAQMQVAIEDRIRLCETEIAHCHAIAKAGGDLSETIKSWERRKVQCVEALEAWIDAGRYAV